MPKILTFVGHYVPGYEAGGPIRSIANIVNWLGHEFSFAVITADRDLGDMDMYPDITHGQWHQVDSAEVMYLSPREQFVDRLKHLLAEVDYDAVYLNGFFSSITVKIALLRRLGLCPAKPHLIAPRGEFSPDAIAIKPWKKKAFLQFARRQHLYSDMLWHATHEFEVEDIRGIICTLENRRTLEGSELLARILVAPNLTSRTQFSGETDRISKQRNELRVSTSVTYCYEKNLAGALRML